MNTRTVETAAPQQPATNSAPISNLLAQWIAAAFRNPLWIFAVKYIFVAIFSQACGPLHRVAETWLGFAACAVFSPLSSKLEHCTKNERRTSLTDLPDDLLYEICSAVAVASAVSARKRRRARGEPSPLHALSMTSKRMREIASPFLFRSINVGHHWTWYKGLKTLNAIGQSPEAQRYTRRFSIELYIGPDGKGPPPPEMLPMKFAATLLHLNRLRKATLILPAYHTMPFRDSFREAGIRLPSIEVLILGPHMDWMIDSCPNVETVSTHDWRWMHTDVTGDQSRKHSFDLIQAAGRAPRLQHFEMMAWWDLALLSSVLSSIPHIRSLALTGGAYQVSLQDLLPDLEQLQSLSTLVLAPATALGIGYTSIHSSTSALTTSDLRRTRQLDEMRESRANKIAARMVLQSCRSVQILWIGDHLRVMRSDGGGTSMGFDITSRCRQGPTRLSSF